MKEHFRFATCYWHTFTWPGLDPFGGQTFERPWMKNGDPVKMAEENFIVHLIFLQRSKHRSFVFMIEILLQKPQAIMKRKKTFSISLI